MRTYIDPVMQARAEIAEENHRTEVDRIKARLRTHKPWWHYLCPFVITFNWRD